MIEMIIMRNEVRSVIFIASIVKWSLEFAKRSKQKRKAKAHFESHIILQYRPQIDIRDILLYHAPWYDVYPF